MTAAVVLAGRFWSFVDEGKWAGARALLADSFRADWPQTEEEVLSADRYIEVNRELLAGANASCSRRLASKSGRSPAS